jgi:hypothetical protein
MAGSGDAAGRVRRQRGILVAGRQTGAQVDARATPGEGWLAEGERTILTRIDTLERRSREVWSLAPA